MRTIGKCFQKIANRCWYRTQTTKVEDLARLSLKTPLYIGVDDSRAFYLRVEQGYCVVPSEKLFALVHIFKEKFEEKVMVFFSSCNSGQISWNY